MIESRTSRLWLGLYASIAGVMLHVMAAMSRAQLLEASRDPGLFKLIHNGLQSNLAVGFASLGMALLTSGLFASGAWAPARLVRLGALWIVVGVALFALSAWSIYAGSLTPGEAGVLANAGALLPFFGIALLIGRALIKAAGRGGS